MPLNIKKTVPVQKVKSVTERRTARVTQTAKRDDEEEKKKQQQQQPAIRGRTATKQGAATRMNRIDDLLKRKANERIQSAQNQASQKKSILTPQAKQETAGTTPTRNIWAGLNQQPGARNIWAGLPKQPETKQAAEPKKNIWAGLPKQAGSKTQPETKPAVTTQTQKDLSRGVPYYKNKNGVVFSMDPDKADEFWTKRPEDYWDGNNREDYDRVLYDYLNGEGAYEKRLEELETDEDAEALEQEIGKVWDGVERQLHPKQPRKYTKAEDQQGYPHSFDVPPERPYKDYVGDVLIGGQERPATIQELYEMADPEMRGWAAGQLLSLPLYRDWLNKNAFANYAKIGDKKDWLNVQQDTDLVRQQGYDEMKEILDEEIQDNPEYDRLIAGIREGWMPDVISAPERTEENERALADFMYGQGYYDGMKNDPEREQKLEQMWAPIEDGTLAAYRDMVEGYKNWETETDYAESMHRVADKQLADIARLEGEKQAYNDLINQYDDNITRPDYIQEYDGGYTDENVIRADVMSNDPSINNDIDRIASFIGGGNELRGFAAAFGDEEGNFKVRNCYKYAMMMTDGSNGSVDEIGIFLNLYNNAKAEGREPTEAMAFLDGLQTSLRARYSEAEKVDNAELARNYPVVASVLSLASHQLQTYMDIPRHIAHLFGDKSTEDYNSWWYSGGRFSEQVEGTIAKDLGEIGGKIYSGIMNSASNLIRALAAPKGSKIAQSVAGLGTFFLQVDQEATARYLKDHSYEEAAAMGAVDGLFEVLEEFLPFETMLGTASKGLLSSMAINGLSELGQEFTGATLGEKLKGMILGEDPEQTRADEIIAQKGYEKDGKWLDLQWMPKGMLIEVANVRAAHEFWTQAVEQGIGGLFGGLLGGTYGTIANVMNTTKTGKTIQSKANTTAGVTGGQKLVEAAAGLDGTESQNLAKKILKKSKAGKNASNYEIGKLAETLTVETGEEIGNITKEVLEDRITGQLKDEGVTGTQAQTIATAITKELTGEKLSKDERLAIGTSKAGLELWRSYNSYTSEDFLGAVAEVNAATQEMKNARKSVMDLMTKSTMKDVTPVWTRKIMDGAEWLEGDALKDVQGKLTGKATEVVADGEVAEVVGFGTRQAEDENGKSHTVATVKLSNGEEADIADIAATNEATAQVMKFMQNEAGRSIGSRMGAKLLELSGNGKNTADLVADAVNILWSEYTETESAKTNLDAKTEEELRKAAQEDIAEDDRRRGKNSKTIRRGEGVVTFDGEKAGSQAYKNKVSRLGAKMQREAEYIADLMKSAGMDVEMYYDEEESAKQGAFNGGEDGEGIRINLAGTFNAQGMHRSAVATVSHEATHWLAANAPQAYKQMRSFTLQNLQKNGMNIRAELRAIMDNYELHGESLDMAGAMEEIVAMGYEQVLTNQQTVQTLKEQDPTLYGKVKQAVQWVLDKLRAIRNDAVATSSRYARALMNVADQAAEIWGIAYKEAQSTEGTGEKAGAKSYSFREEETDQEYKRAVESGDMDAAQYYVNMAAENAGYTDEAYHGSAGFGFTEFNMEASQGQIFVAYNSDLASTYVENGEVRNISDAVNYDDLSGEELAKVFIEQKGTENGGEYEDARFISREDLKQRVYDHITRIEKNAKFKSWTEAKRKDMINFVAQRTGVDQSAFENAKTPGELESQVIRTILEGKSKYGENGVMMIKMMINPIIENYAINKSGKKLTLREQDELLHSVAYDIDKALKNEQGLFEVREEGIDAYWTMKREEITGKLNGGVYRLFTKPGKQLIVDAGYESWNNIPVEAVQEAAGYTDDVMRAWPTELGLRTRQIARWAEAHGYDSVRINNVYDDGGMGEFSEYETAEGDIGIFFNQRNVKSADAVVYDDNGEIIPPSERFNAEKKDIRWSLQDDMEKQMEGAYRTAYDKMTDLRLKLSELQGDIDAFNKRIESTNRDEWDEIIREMKEWEERTGYGQLKKDYEEAKKAYEKANQDWEKYIEERDVAEEQKKIEASGLTEAEWRRKQAAKEFGYTTNFNEAGYLLPDGKMLNFSGEKRHTGHRAEDHRAIGRIYASNEMQGGAAMFRFMQDGNIRVMAESPGIDIATNHEPTTAQYNQIRSMVSKFADEEYFNVDLTDDRGYSAGNLEYEGRLNPSKVVNDIRNFFQTGKVREQSVVSQFHDTSYSIRMDDDYMAAVKRGDMETAQAIMDHAAEEAGYIVLGFHGTLSGGFTVFDKKHAHVGGNSGAGFYFSSNEDDSEANYSDIEGADNHFKVEHLVEKIQDYIAESGENEYNGVKIPEEASYEELEEIAKEMLNRTPQTYKVYMDQGNVYIRDFNNSTDLMEHALDDFDENDYNRDDFDDEEQYEETLMEERDDMKYQWISDAVYEGIADVDSNFEIVSNVDYEKIISELWTKAVDWDRLTWNDVKDVIQDQYIDVLVGEDQEAADGTTEITRAIVEAFGFDSIEDREVGKKFNQLKNMGYGDTVHYIMFRPDQIKLADPVTRKNDGEIIKPSERFKKGNMDIRFSMRDDTDYDVRQWMETVPEWSLQTEAEKQLLKKYGSLRRKVQMDQLRMDKIDEELKKLHRVLYEQDDESIRAKESIENALEKAGVFIRDGHWLSRENVIIGKINDDGTITMNKNADSEVYSILKKEAKFGFTGRTGTYYGGGLNAPGYEDASKNKVIMIGQSEAEKQAAALKIKKQNLQTVMDQTEEELNKILSDEGFGRMMYRQQKVLEDFAYNKTQAEVTDAVGRMEQAAKAIRTRIEENRAAAEKLEKSGVVARFRELLGTTTAEQTAADLKKEFSSTWTKAQIRTYLDPIILKMKTGEDFQADVETLAGILVESDSRNTYEELAGLRGLTITIGKGAQKELKGQNSSLKEIRARLAGTGITVKYGERTTLEADIEDLRAEYPGMPEFGNEKDALENFVQWVEGMKQASASQEFYDQRIAEAMAVITGKAAGAAKGIYMPNDPKAQKQVLAMMDFVKGMNAETAEAQKALEDIAKQMEAMEKAGAVASNKAQVLMRDVNVALDYYNKISRIAVDEAKETKTSAVIEQLKSKQAQEILKNNEEWRNLIQRDKEAREQLENNRKLVRQINTCLKRMWKRLKTPKGTDNIPEHMQGLAREVLGMFVNNDMGYGLRFLNATKDGLKEMKRVLDAWEAQDGKFDMKQLDGVNEAVQDTIERDLDNIHEGLQLINEKIRGKNKKDALQIRGSIIEQIQQSVSEIYTAIKAQQEVFVQGQKVKVEDAAYAVAQGTNGKKYREWKGAAGQKIALLHKFIVSGNMTPEYFFRMLGNEGLSTLWGNYHDAENRNGLELKKAKDRLAEIAEQYHYDQWDMNKKQTVHLESGDVEMTLGQIMSLWATWQREQTLGPEMSEHLTKGGFYADVDLRDGLLGRQAVEKRAHRVTEEDMGYVLTLLTPDQMNFVDAVVGFMSKDMSALGNEASMAAYGIKLYKESYYFPFQIWNGVKSRKSNDAGSAAGMQDRAFHPSFSKSRTHGANNAVMIGDFMQTATDHIAGMINYATMGLANESLMKVLNQQTPGEIDKRNTEAILEEAYGHEAMQYLRELQAQLNGGAVRTERSIADKAISLFRKNAVAGSLSVALQQPLSYIRAAMMISPKYLTQAVMKEYWKGSYKELVEHSGVAVIKDMGKWDMNAGASAREYLTPEGKESTGRTVWNTIGEYATILPNKMDAWTWTRMWVAVKAEQHAEHPEMDVKSDEFLDMCGVRFNDIMRRTQVYDSTLVRSANMRSQHFWMKSITSFMAEPTLTINVLADAVRMAKNHEKGGLTMLRKAGETFILSAIMQAAVKGLMGAGRNPDEKKTWLENFLYRFWMNLLGEANPFGLIPGYSDMVTLVKNGELSDDAMGAIGKIVTATKGTASLLLNGPGEKGLERDLEDTVGQLVQIFTNIPMKNLMRDTRAIANFITQPYAKRPTSLAVLKYQMEQARMNTDTLVSALMKDAGFKTTNAVYYERIYEAKKAGNEQAAQDMIEYLLKGKGVTQDKIDSGVAGAAKKDKNTTAAEKAEFLIAEGENAENYIRDQMRKGGLNADQARELLKKADPEKDAESIWWSVDRIQYQLDTGAKEAPGGYYYRLTDAINSNSSNDIRTAVKSLLDHGVEKDKVQKKLSDWKSEYLAATGNEKVQLKNALIQAYKALGINETEANEIINKWSKTKKKN